MTITKMLSAVAYDIIDDVNEIYIHSNSNTVHPNNNNNNKCCNVLYLSYLLCYFKPTSKRKKLVRQY